MACELTVFPRITLQTTAHAVGLTAEVIEDAGRTQVFSLIPDGKLKASDVMTGLMTLTQIPEGSMTVLAVGPGTSFCHTLVCIRH